MVVYDGRIETNITDKQTKDMSSYNDGYWGTCTKTMKHVFLHGSKTRKKQTPYIHWNLRVPRVLPRMNAST